MAHILKSLSGTSSGPVLGAHRISQSDADLIIENWLPEYAGLGCRDILYRIRKKQQKQAKPCTQRECDC